MAAQAGMASLLANMRIPDGVNPVAVNLPKPPKLEGPLAPNNFLSKAVRFADNMVVGPESMVVVNGYVYTGLSDGWVVEVNPRGEVKRIRRMSMPSCRLPNPPEDACGRPLGIRADSRGYLVVADAYNGIFRINPVTGQYRQLVFARNQQVNGKPLGFINDLAIAKDGTIFFTSSSTKYTRTRYLDIILEGETSGRVLVYNPRAAPGQQVQELVTNLNFPNGLELSADESYLLIGEAARARIFKAYIGQDSPKRGQIETFAENLPGFVDNIRRTSRDTFWVGLSSVRHDGSPSVLDEYGDQPKIRGAIMGMPRDQVMQRAPKYAIVVELDDKGRIIRSLHDPQGTLFTAVSELQEEGDTLYIGSFDRPFIGLLKLSDLPSPLPADQATNETTTPTDNTGGNNATQDLNQQLSSFLSQIRQRLMPMSKPQVDSIVLALVESLVNAKVSELRAKQAVTAKDAEIQRLRNQIQSLGGSTATTTAALPSDQTQAQGTTASPGGATTTTSSASGTTSSGGAGSATTAAPASGTTSASGGGDTTTTGGAAGTTQAGAGDTTTQAAASGTTQAGASGTTQAGAAGTTQAGTTQAAAAGTTAAGGDTTTQPSGTT